VVEQQRPRQVVPPHHAVLREATRQHRPCRTCTLQIRSIDQSLYSQRFLHIFV
jgi:transposase